MLICGAISFTPWLLTTKVNFQFVSKLKVELPSHLYTYENKQEGGGERKREEERGGEGKNLK